MSVINYLFNKGYYPIPKGFEFSDKNKAIFNNPEHKEFKEALLEECCKKLAVHLEDLSKPIINLEHKGELNAIKRLYEELINMFAPKQEIQQHKYVDPYRRIEEETRKSFANKNDID